MCVCGFFHVINANRADNYFFQEMHSEQNPEVRQTGGGAKRVETVRDEITYNFVGANETLIRSILLLTAGQRKRSPNKKAKLQCETCGKVFTRVDNLRRHQGTHSKEKEHQCSKCEKSFHRKSDLKRHENQVHERRAAQREYKCATCGEAFNNMAPFRAHQKTAHTTQPTRRKRPPQQSGHLR